MNSDASPGSLYPKQKFNRSRELTEDLRQLAWKLGPGAKLPTIRALRDSHGVSLATVYSALDALENETVIERRHGSGIYVAAELGRKTVAVLMSPHGLQAPEHSPFWEMLFAQIQRQAQATDEMLHMHFTQLHGHLSFPLRLHLIRARERGELHGVIGVALAEESAEWVEEQNLPLVHLFGPAKVAVLLDDSALIHMGVQALARRGCRNLALWCPTSPQMENPEWALEQFEHYQQNFVAAVSRIKGCRAVLSSEFRSQYGCPAWKQGRAAALSCFTRPRDDWPSGILIADDTMASGALLQMSAMGVEPGRDVHVATHSNFGTGTLREFEERVDLLQYNPEKVVEQVFERLRRAMAGQKVEPRRLHLKPKLILSAADKLTSN